MGKKDNTGQTQRIEGLDPVEWLRVKGITKPPWRWVPESLPFAGLIYEPVGDEEHY